jgi:succinate dehydrogenase / fumarate reductase membrane anchor subunit
MRSPFGSAIWLGSAKTGVEHWWAERVSAVALVPLTIWFLAAIIFHTRSDHAGFVAWLREFPTTILIILLLIALFHHAALGLQVIVEDYVHSDLKFAVIVGVRLTCFAAAVAGILAALQIALAS